jgi:glycerol-3-phosphate dehydrogenase
VVGGEAQVAVIGGGVVGCAVAHALARHGVGAVLLEAELDLACGASGANSGILHSGFDSAPGELETQLILRAATLREELLDELAVPLWRCGALLEPRSSDERAAVARLAENARANGVTATLDAEGSLSVPGESLTDPVAFTRALADAARVGGATIRLGTRVTRLASAGPSVAVELDTGERLHVSAAVNCAGLHADGLARSAGDELVELYPRKGEFLVFAQQQQPALGQILLPVPSALGKGVLVFPTVDHRAIIAGPTAREREDKRDRAVETDAAELILERARRVYPALGRLEPLGAYAGLRPAGRDANYVIEHSRALPGLIHVAAIRSTGLSASLAIGEHVLGMLARGGVVAAGAARALPAPVPAAHATHAEAWWQRAARRSGESARGRESEPRPGAV